ncbi:hypothetical protein MMC13_005267 [Lambiella insularis]|nr:hypothetical protein [Lambiella insularis]
MFWRFGGYANVSSLDTILDKPDVTLEELLDESDLIQELKQHNTKLIEYLRDENVLRRLLEYVVAPALIEPEEDEDEDDDDEDEPEPLKKKRFSPVRSLSLGRSKEDKEKTKRQEEREEQEKADKARQKYAYTACEILASETWSIIEALMENQAHMRQFWGFLRREPPLDPVAANYFTKINETLLDKKTEDTLEFVRSLDGIVSAMLQHVDCPMVMDLLLKMISLEKGEGGQGIVDWLQSQDLMPLLLGYLGKEHPTFTQTSAGDFIKAIITISANASQNEQSCIGPNSLTRQLVSEPCIELLITDMLRGGNPLTVGVGIVIEVIRKNNSDYDPDVGAGQDLAPSSSDPIYLGTLLRLFAKHVPDFTELILSPNHTVSQGDSTMVVKRKELKVAFGASIEPLGFDRFKTCELMAELLHCSNMGLLNERGSEAFVIQRDQEREKLKVEGSLMRNREPQSAVTEFSEDSTGYQNGASPTGHGAESPEETRRLEVANSAEDDEFEDVGALSDEIKDEFDEKSPFELESNVALSASPIKPIKARLDLDEEFVDEPLTSPRLQPVDEKEVGTKKPPTSINLQEPSAISPSSAVTAGVQKPGLHSRGDVDDKQRTETTEKPLTEEATADALVEELTSQISPQMQAASSDAPPLPHRDRNHLATKDLAESGTSQDISPHPDDKPAPLFAERPEESLILHEAAPNPSEPAADGSGSQDTIDTTLGEEGDSARSPVPENDQSFAPHIESDVDGQPIVGDFLKMMFVEHQVVPTILDFFFRFPWNNFLHNVVYDVVQQVFNGPMDRGYNRSLAIDLFQTGRITERIIEGQLRSDEAQARNNMRLGYMGHLTLIAEEVVKFSERHPAELLSPAVLDKVTSKLWSDYVEYKLSETRERDAAILGGVRPDLALGPRQAVLNAVNAAQGFGNVSSNALANAGLNGGGNGLDSLDLTSTNAGSGTTSLSLGGSLLSVFGGSSDEEDEEMEEIGEHEEGAGATSEQYPGYQPSSLSALSIFSPPLENPSSNFINTISSAHPNPPPNITSAPDAQPAPLPPPLNIPPSRARRQLAARLALHGKGSPLSSPQASPNEHDGSNPASLNAILASSSDSQAFPSGAPSGEAVPVGLTGNTHDQGSIVREAIASQKSETPFGDLAELDPGAAGMWDERRWGGDWVDFEDGEEDGPEEEEEEDGEDVPITMALDLGKRAPPGAAGPKSPTGDAGEKRRVAGKMSDLFRQSGSSSGSESGSSDEEEGRGRGRVGVREARVRSLIEDED